MLAAAQYIIPPLVGALIGYSTNWIAIKMLFRPHRPIFVFNYQLPFTPGLIPKEQKRLAKAIGATIAENLINPETLKATLLSAETKGKLDNAINDFFGKLCRTDETLQAMILQYVEEEELDDTRKTVEKALAAMIHERLACSELGDTIAELSIEHVKKSLGSGMTTVISIIPGLLDSLKRFIATNVNLFLKSSSQEVVENLTDQQIDQLLQTPVSEIVSLHSDQLSAVRRQLLLLYDKLVEHQLPQMLRGLDIAAVVEKRINDMSIVEAEGIVMSIVSREFQAICLLGAILGAMIGVINIFF